MSPFKRHLRSSGKHHLFELSLPPRQTNTDNAKRRAKLAFSAYDEAMRNGEQEVAKAARLRFLGASRELGRARKRGLNG